LIRNPTQAQVDAVIASVTQFDSPIPPPGSINAIVNNPLENVASVHASGVDVSISARGHTAFGDLASTLDVAYLRQYDQRSTSAAPVIHLLDTLTNPVKKRARFGTSWANHGFGIAGFLNYVGSYDISDLPGSRSIASWTTADLQLSFKSAAAGGASSVLGDTDLSISVVNIFDRDPPFANGSTGYGFDDANANPYGRMLGLNVTHRW
jgi:hypothetical protein